MQEQINEEAVTISESLPKNDKELVTKYLQRNMND